MLNLRVAAMATLLAVAGAVTPVTPQDDQETLAFPTGHDVVTLPTTFAIPHIYVRVMIGDRGLDFVLDTGACGIAIDAEVLKQLGVHATSPQMVSAARKFESLRAIVPEMRIGDVVMRNVRVQTIPFAENEVHDVRVVGLLGGDFIRRVGMTIDYKNKRVTVMPADKYVPPAPTPASQVLPMRILGGCPVIPVVINGASAEQMIIDTGGATDLMLFNTFTRAHPEALAPRVAFPLLSSPYFKGVGGTFPTRGYRLQSVDIGMFHFPNFGAIAVASAGSYSQVEDGIVGPGILAHFTVGFDYTGGKLYLVHEVGQ